MDAAATSDITRAAGGKSLSPPPPPADDDDSSVQQTAVASRKIFATDTDAGLAFLASLSGLWPREALHAAGGRQACPMCGASRRHYCYDCFEVLRDVVGAGTVPRVPLPLRVDIIKDPRESNSKSTAVQARVLAPDDLALHVFPETPRHIDPARTLLLFPDASATSLSQVDPSSYDRVVFLDGTWAQAKTMLRTTPELQPLRRVKIDTTATHYWRPQHGRTDTDLATVEAVYYFLRNHLLQRDGRYDGQVDNLLFFFAFHYELVHRRTR
jgi:DTW domain-containing protein YfiP